MANKDYSVNGFIVIIEWDGRIPPTPYYHRLRNMTGGVRLNDDKGMGVVQRRTEFVDDDEQRGIILQEGTVITPSRSLARGIAIIAKRYGARDVHIGEVSLNTFHGVETFADKMAMSRIDEAFGRRGRPAKPSNWMVTCIEDMASIFVEEVSYVANCPRCGGFNIVTYPSKNPIEYEYVVESGGQYSVADEWLVTRFGNGVFMMPRPLDISGNVSPAPKKLCKNVSTVTIKDSTSQDIVDKLLASDFCKRALDTDGGNDYEYLTALDGIFASLRYIDESDRQDARLKAVMQIMSGGYKGYISMTGDPDEIDVLDAAGVLEPNRVEAMFHSLG